MSFIDAATWGIASACLTLALMHLRVWWSDRSAWANVGFAILATGVALFGLAEHAMVRAATPERFAEVLRWAHVPIFMMVVGIVWFVAAYFRTGRWWLASAACGVNLLTLAVNFGRDPNVDYWAVTGITRVQYFGETVSLAAGRTSAWHWIVQFSFVLVLAFVADASASLWRAGNRELRRRALGFGLSVLVFVTISAGQAALIFAGILHVPHLVAMSFFPVLLVMGYELSGELLRAARLARELQASEASLRESERRMAVAAAEAQQLSGRLIHAQEDERRRIARELHDDVSQRLALLAVQLDLLRRARGEAAFQARIERLASDVRSLSSEIHALSHTLHPAKLEQLGLVTATRAWCRDLAAQSGVEIAFRARDVPADVDAEASLCVYRLVQEATRNIVRHSHAATGEVQLYVDERGVHLVVQDPGCGFDPDVARGNGGLGLVSMRERVRSLEGTLGIESRKGGGTRLEAVVPVRKPTRSRDEAGRRPEVAHASR